MNANVVSNDKGSAFCRSIHVRAEQIFLTTRLGLTFPRHVYCNRTRAGVGPLTPSSESRTASLKTPPAA